MRFTINRFFASICVLMAAGVLQDCRSPLAAQAGELVAGKLEKRAAAASQPAPATDAGLKAGTTANKTSDKPLSVKLISVTSPVHAGDDATINVQTAPRSKCDIAVKLKSGLSKAKGLESKDANNTGRASWTWKVAKNTAPGPMLVTVNCAWGEKKGTLQTTVEVQK